MLSVDVGGAELLGGHKGPVEGQIHHPGGVHETVAEVVTHWGGGGGRDKRDGGGWEGWGIIGKMGGDRRNGKR